MNAHVYTIYIYTQSAGLDNKPFLRALMVFVAPSIQWQFSSSCYLRMLTADIPQARSDYIPKPARQKTIAIHYDEHDQRLGI